MLGYGDMGLRIQESKPKMMALDWKRGTDLLFLELPVPGLGTTRELWHALCKAAFQS